MKLHHGSFFDCYETAEMFLESGKERLSVEFNSYGQAVNWRTRFNRWRVKMRGQDVTRYDAIKLRLPKKGEPGDHIVHLDLGTSADAAPKGARLIDPETGEPFFPEGGKRTRIPSLPEESPEPEPEDLDAAAAEFLSRLNDEN